MKQVTLKIIDKVARILKASTGSRNSDSVLIANFWYFELIEKGYSQEFAKDFCKIISDGTLTNTESIRRCRQKLQQENPEEYGFNKVRNEKKHTIKQQLKA